ATGLALTVASAPWIPSALPIAAIMAITLSNPGEMERAADEWEEAAKKFEEFATELKEKIDGLSGEFWTSDDRDAFNFTHEQFKGEVEKATNIMRNVASILHVSGGVYFALACLTLAIGIFLAALAVLVQTTIAIPFVGEGVIAAANSIAAALIDVAHPAMFTVRGVAMAGSMVVGMCVAALIGTYSGQALSLGKGTPQFKDVTVNLPKAKV
ncbi:MAG: hypothetical protein FWJ90_23845, partial [Actinomadura sp.]